MAAWLIRSTTTDPAPGQAASSAQQYQHARDTHEAISIGQELLSCGLLVAVCSGFEEDDSLHRDLDEDDAGFPGEESSTIVPGSTTAASSVAAGGGGVSSGATPIVEVASMKNSPHLTFSVMPGYIYRYDCYHCSRTLW